MNSVKTFSNNNLIDFFLQVFLKGNWKCSYLSLVLDLMIVRRSLSSCFRVYFSVIVIVVVVVFSLGLSFFCFPFILSLVLLLFTSVRTLEKKEISSLLFLLLLLLLYFFLIFFIFDIYFSWKNATQTSFIEGEYSNGKKRQFEEINWLTCQTHQLDQSWSR